MATLLRRKLFNATLLAFLGVTAFTTFASAAQTDGLSLYFMGANLLAETYAAKVDCSTIVDSLSKMLTTGLIVLQPDLIMKSRLGLSQRNLRDLVSY